MIKHIVMWKFKEEAQGKTKQENMDYVKSNLYALTNKIDEIKSMEIGQDITHGEMSYDMVLITEFESVQALDTYRVHPEHVKVSKYVREVIFERGAIDFNF